MINKTASFCKIDPRTKIIMMTILDVLFYIAPFGYCILCFLVPFALFIFEKKIKTAFLLLVTFILFGFLFYFVRNNMQGLLASLLIIPAMIFYRFMPIMATCFYVISTTTIGEFVAAMDRIHVPRAITIPFAVIFRFFPTILDEMKAIDEAMRMRGIHLFSFRTLKNPLNILEYRLVPLLISITKIGDELSVASLTRGLSTSTKRTHIAKIGFGVPDIIILLYCIMVIALFIILGKDFFGGILA